MLFAAIFLPNLAIQAVLAARPELRKVAIALIDGKPPLLRVIAANDQARKAGVEIGLMKVQAEIPGVNVLLRSPELEQAAHASLLACAGSFSPTVQDKRPDLVLVDVDGLKGLFGLPKQIAAKMRSALQQRHLYCNVAVAGNPDTATVAALGYHGVTIVTEAKQIAPLPITLLDPSSELLETTRLWGITTLGELAAFEPVALSQRLGQEGVTLQKLARGEQVNPFVADENELDFTERAELEYPIDLLDSLSFVLSSMLECICSKLEQHSLSTNEVDLELALDPPTVAGENLADAQRSHSRTIKLPNPTTDHNLLLRLFQLDLKSHPPSAPVIKLSLRADAVRPRQIQQSLFAPLAPDPDKMELTLARLASLVGEGEVGSPELIDTHRPRGFLMTRFAPPEPSRSGCRQAHPSKVALRLFEPAKRAAIRIRQDAPLEVSFEGRRGEVIHHSGPWFASGDWWTTMGWSRKEWDVQLRFDNGAVQDYRIFLDLHSKQGFVEGSYD
jgi:protein ImuB